MTQAQIFELVGYLASALIVLSLMMSNLWRLRIVNLVGAAVFALYGALIGAVPVLATNGAIVLIDLWYLWRMARREDFFQLLEVDADSAYLRGFLDFHAEGIRSFQPDADYAPSRGQIRVFALRDMVPAGLLVVDPAGGGAYRVRIDYATPGYRDRRIARYLFVDRAAWWRERGVRELVARPGAPEHEAYLRRVGFRRAEDGTYRRAPG